MAEKPYYVVNDASGVDVRICSTTTSCVMWRSKDGVTGEVIVYTGAPGEGGVVDLGPSTLAQFNAFLAAFKNAANGGVPTPVDFFAVLDEAGSFNKVAASINGALSMRASADGTKTYLYTTSHYASPLLIDDTIDNVANALNIAAYGAP